MVINTHKHLPNLHSWAESILKEFKRAKLQLIEACLNQSYYLLKQPIGYHSSFINLSKSNRYSENIINLSAFLESHSTIYTLKKCFLIQGQHDKVRNAYDDLLLGRAFVIVTMVIFSCLFWPANKKCHALCLLFLIKKNQFSPVSPF